MELSESERVFVRAAVRRKRVFALLSAAGVAVGLTLAGLATWRWLRETGDPVGLHAVIALLVLLNARQQLRQVRYARILEKLWAGDAPER